MRKMEVVVGSGGGGVLVVRWMVEVTQLRAKLKLYGLQTLLLGALAAWIGQRHGEPALLVTGTAVALLKGIAVPIYLGRAVDCIGCRRDEGLVLAPPLLLFVTMSALGVLVLLHP